MEVLDKVNSEISLLGSNCTENNLAILKRVIFRFAEKIVTLNNNILENGDVERIKFLVNNIVSKYPFATDVKDYLQLEENGYHVEFKSGSALSKISPLMAKNREDDIDVIVGLYVNESTIFLSELRNVVRPTISSLIASFDDAKRVKIKTTGSNYNIKLVGDVELFDSLKDSNKLNVVGAGSLPATLSVGFPLRNEISESEDLVRRLFVTNDEEVNNMVKPIVDSFSVEELLKFWNSYMLNISVENSSLMSLYNLHFRKTTDLILLYAALTRILDGEVEYVTNLAVLEANIINIRDMLHTMIDKYLKYVETVANNSFILDYFEDNSLTNIFISNNGYNKFLEDGGSVDSVVGYVIKSKQNNLPRYASLENVLNDSTLKMHYENSVKLEKMSDHSYNVRVISDQWLAYVGKIINDFNNCTTNDVKVCQMKVCEDKQAVIIEYVKNLNSEDVFDTNKVILNIVKIINPEVGNFITNMNSLMSSDGRNSEDLAKEAGLYAAIQRLADKLLSDTYTVKK